MRRSDILSDVGGRCSLTGLRVTRNKTIISLEKKPEENYRRIPLQLRTIDDFPMGGVFGSRSELHYTDGPIIRCTCCIQ